jgi:hypothetical protein
MVRGDRPHHFRASKRAPPATRGYTTCEASAVCDRANGQQPNYKRASWTLSCLCALEWLPGLSLLAQLEQQQQQ